MYNSDRRNGRISNYSNDCSNNNYRNSNNGRTTTKDIVVNIIVMIEITIIGVVTEITINIVKVHEI